MPFHYVEGGMRWYMQRGGTISTSVSAAQPVAMGRFHFTHLFLTLLSIVSAQRTSQGVQQQLRQQQQQSEIRNVGSQQAGRFRGSRGPRLRQPTIISVSPEEQALADSFNFNIPFRTPADFVRAPGRFARALWDIEVGQ